MSASRGLGVARRAAVEIVTTDARHLGVGLLLDVPDAGPVVLTCHHVVAQVQPGGIRVRPQDGKLRVAKLDEQASQIDCDAAVLVLDEPIDAENPLLHVPDPDEFEGPLGGRAISPGGSTGNFGVTLQAADTFTTDVTYEPRRYTLPAAFLLGVDDAQGGISGSPVRCELGVVGLIHFARDASPTQAMAAYLNPLTAWVPGLPGLEQLIEPFATAALRDRAEIYWANADLAAQLHIRGLRSAVYVPRPEDAQARQAFEQGRGLCLIGRQNSGKSRLVCQLLRDNPRATVVLPEHDEPPPDVGAASDFRNRDVILVFENVHVGAAEWKPLLWYERFRKVTRRTTLLLTSWNADEWTKVKGIQHGLLEVVVPEEVFLSEDEGQKMSDEAGWELAQKIGMDAESFGRRFDGTPGSLVVDEDVPPAPAEALPEGGANGTAIVPVTPEQVAEEIPTNLPRLTSSFIGRERELTAAADALAAGPLVTLTGPRGAGKTRLALRVASELAERFPDGVWCVDLGPVRDSDQVTAIVAASVGAPRRALLATENALLEYLPRRRALVVINGPEHVLAKTASLVARLTADDTALRILVAVREPLGVPGEQVIGLEPLTSDGAAKRLFLDRIAPEGAEPALGPEDHSRAETLYSELEGNPAALEITAAQVRDTGLRGAIAARERQAGEAHPGPGGALRLAVRRSLDDISAPEAAVFARLSVLPDWFTLSAARAVTAGGEVDKADVPQLLRKLVDRALVLIDGRDSEAQRFRLLASLRELAEEQLAALDGEQDARRRHAEYFLDLALRGARRLDGRAGQRWLERLERDRVHLRVALRWSIANDLAAALQLGAALWMPFLVRSHFSEGRRWLDDVLDAALPRLEALSPEAVGALSDVLIGAGYLAYHQADYDAVKRYQRQVRAVSHLPGARSTRGDELNLLGLVARRERRYPIARKRLSQAVGISRRKDNLAELADRLNTLGNIIRESGGNLDDAAAHQHQSFSLYGRVGSARGCAMAQCDLAYVLMDQGELAAARTHFARSLSARRRLEDKQGEGQSLNGLGLLERLAGDPDLAITRHTQALELFDSIGDRLRTAESLEALGLAHSQAGRGDMGRGLIARAEELRAAVGAPRPPGLVKEIESVASDRAHAAA